MRHIGWYVHHHGVGHRTRFLAVRPHVAASVIAFSSLPEPEALPGDTTWVQLPRDDTDEGRGAPADASPTAGGALHWAPLGHRGHAERLATLAAHAPQLDAVVVDVSVEVTVLARLLGLPVALFAQPGDRSDEPHALGRRLAAAVIAPWPVSASDPAPADRLASASTAGADLHHVGGLSRFAGRDRASAPFVGTVLALGGGERDPEWEAMLDAAVAATPGWRWRRAGGSGGARGSGPEWIDDPWNALCEAEVVVTASGQNAIADVAAAGARAVVVARPRPFDEQVRTADALRRLGLAVVPTGVPDTPCWRSLLDRARALDPDWSRWRVAGAAERAAAVIDGVAKRTAMVEAER